MRVIFGSLSGLPRAATAFTPHRTTGARAGKRIKTVASGPMDEEDPNSTRCRARLPSVCGRALIHNAIAQVTARVPAKPLESVRQRRQGYRKVTVVRLSSIDSADSSGLYISARESAVYASGSSSGAAWVFIFSALIATLISFTRSMIASRSESARREPNFCIHLSGCHRC